MRVSWKLTAAITAIVIAILSYGVHYTQGMPTEENVTSTLCSYLQKTECGYTAHLQPNVLYGETAGEGDTIYIKLMDLLDVTFNYTFQCSEKGIIETDYLINTRLDYLGETGWSKPIDELVSVETMKMEDTSSASLGAVLTYNITEICELIDMIQEETGAASSTYQVTTKINVNTVSETSAGTISRPIEQGIVLKLDYRGSYYDGRGGVAEVDATELNLPGSITENLNSETWITVMGRWVSVTQLRITTLALLGTWIAVGSSLTAWSYRTDVKEFERLPELKKIIRRFKSVESEDIPDLKAQTLTSMIALKMIADDYGSMIFHCETADGDIFFTTDNNILYKYILDKTVERRVEERSEAKRFFNRLLRKKI